MKRLSLNTVKLSRYRGEQSIYNNWKYLNCIPELGSQIILDTREEIILGSTHDENLLNDTLNEITLNDTRHKITLYDTRD